MSILLLFVGPAKTLTSSLDRIARGFKHISLPRFKESHYLCDDELSLKYYSHLIPSFEERRLSGQEFYRAFDEGLLNNYIACEFCPSYTFSKRAMEFCNLRYSNVFPVITYRDPVARTKSHINMDVRLGLLTPDHIGASSLLEIQKRQYYALSDYANILELWISYSRRTIFLDPLSGQFKTCSDTLVPEEVAAILNSLTSRVSQIHSNKASAIPPFIRPIYRHYVRYNLKLPVFFVNSIKNGLDMLFENEPLPSEYLSPCVNMLKFKDIELV